MQLEDAFMAQERKTGGDVGVSWALVEMPASCPVSVGADDSARQFCLLRNDTSEIAMKWVCVLLEGK